MSPAADGIFQNIFLYISEQIDVIKQRLLFPGFDLICFSKESPFDNTL